MMHINSLPVLVLHLIFDKLSLQDLVSIGRVCALWRSYQLDITRKVDSLSLWVNNFHNSHKQIINLRFTLKYRDLLLNDDGTRMYSPQYLPNWFHIIYNPYEFSNDCAEKLAEILPNITTLEITYLYPYSRGVLTLLTKLAPKLKSLKIYLQNIKEDKETFDLQKVINSMSALEHLSLHNACLSNVENRFEHFFSSYFLNLPILGKLKEFYLYNCDYRNIENSLDLYVRSNTNLKQMGLNLRIYDFRKFSSAFPRLVNKIVHLPLYNPEFFHIQTINRFQSFHSLSCLHLELQFSEDLLTGGLNLLHSLKHLTHLHFKLSKFNKLKSTNQVNRVAKLVSVQVLTLAATLESKFSFESNHWAHVFPSVQVIEFKMEFSSNISSGNDKIFLSKQQLQQALSSFVQCPKLRHLYTKVFKDEINDASELDEWIVLDDNHGKIIIEVGK